MPNALVGSSTSVPTSEFQVRTNFHTLHSRLRNYGNNTALRFVCVEIGGRAKAAAEIAFTSCLSLDPGVISCLRIFDPRQLNPFRNPLGFTQATVTAVSFTGIIPPGSEWIVEYAHKGLAAAPYLQSIVHQCRPQLRQAATPFFRGSAIESNAEPTSTASPYSLLEREQHSEHPVVESKQVPTNFFQPRQRCDRWVIAKVYTFGCELVSPFVSVFRFAKSKLTAVTARSHDVHIVDLANTSKHSLKIR